jgi:hypothetical protein
MKSLIIAALLGVSLAQSDCSYYQNLQCTSGQQTNNPVEWADRVFQTPLASASDYQSSYEGRGRIVCYNNIVYSHDRLSATVEARCRQHSSIVDVKYNWNNEGF